jgi:hypothetical protein
VIDRGKWTNGKFDRPKPTAGHSAKGRRIYKVLGSYKVVSVERV